MKREICEITQNELDRFFCRFVLCAARLRNLLVYDCGSCNKLFSRASQVVGLKTTKSSFFIEQLFFPFRKKSSIHG
jgi:hypothetical protein